MWDIRKHFSKLYKKVNYSQYSGKFHKIHPEASVLFKFRSVLRSDRIPYKKVKKKEEEKHECAIIYFYVFSLFSVIRSYFK